MVPSGHCLFTVFISSVLLIKVHIFEVIVPRFSDANKPAPVIANKFELRDSF